MLRRICGLPRGPCGFVLLVLRPLKTSPCRLATVKLAEHMPRLAAEHSLAAALGTKVTYSLYANNLLGGVVEYRDCHLPAHRHVPARRTCCVAAYRYRKDGASVAAR